MEPYGEPSRSRIDFSAMQEALRRHNPRSEQGFRTLAELAAMLAHADDGPAIVAFRREGQRCWTYRELARRVEAASAVLAEAGFAKGDVLALAAENRPEWIAMALAALRLGVVIAPIDAEQDDDTLGHILKDSGAKLIGVSATTAERVKEIGSTPGRVVIEDATSDPGRRDAPPAADAEPSDIAVLFYTSGTTGRPKGVPLTHANLTFQLRALIDARVVKSQDRVLLPLPLHHVFPFVIGMLAPVSLRLPIILPRALTGSHVATALREGGATAVIGVPRLYSALIDGLQARAAARGRFSAKLFGGAVWGFGRVRRWTGLRAGRALLPLHRRLAPDLKLLVSGGAALDPELALRLEGLGWKVATGYGLTETSPILTWNLPGEADLFTAGKPVPGVEVRIEPSALGEGQQPPDEARGQQYGEILARGPGVFDGYRNLPKTTEKDLSRDGWFRTGDLGFVDRNGFLHILGRVKTMLVTEGGKNIAPETVEEVYLGAPEIREFAVLQKDERLVGLVVSEPREAGHGEEMRRAVEKAIRERSRTLPSYQRISGHAITSEPIPRTRIGKPKRHLLAEQYERARKRPASEETGAAQPIEPHEMSSEDRRLVQAGPAREVWGWLASRYPDRHLTPDSSPQLDLGVDSVEWLTITMEIGQRTGIELSEEAIERIETVRDLLREVAEAGEAGERFDASLLDDPEAQLSDEQKRWLEPVEGGSFHMAGLLHRLNRPLARWLFRLRVKGLERLPEGQALFAPTHGSILDPFALAAALDRQRLSDTFWVGDADMAFGNPLTRSVSRLAQAMPIDTRKGFLSGIALAATALKRGHSLIWFPEGRRAHEDAVQDLMPGIGILLERFPVPVVPVAIHGAHQAYPPGRYLPRPGRVTVAFGELLDPNELRRGGGDSAQAITGALHDRLVALYEETRPTA